MPGGGGGGGGGAVAPNLFCAHGCGAMNVGGNFVAGTTPNVTAATCPNNGGNGHFMVPVGTPAGPDQVGQDIKEVLQSLGSFIHSVESRLHTVLVKIRAKQHSA